MSHDLGRKDEVASPRISPPPEAPTPVHAASSRFMGITSVLSALAMWMVWGLGLAMLVMMASLPLLEWLAQGPDRVTR